MSIIRFSNGEINLTDYKNTIPFTLSEYEKTVLDFCLEWLDGKITFQFYTSGSTGDPKPVTLTRNQMIFSARLTQKALSLKKCDQALVCLNTNYIAGKMMLVRSLVIGMDMTIVEPSSNPFKNLKNIAIDFIALVPLQIQTILSTEQGFEILNKIQNILIGGAPTSTSLVEKLKNLKGNVYSTFGMTETVSHIALCKINGVIENDFYTVLEGVEINQDARGCLTINSELTNHELVVTNDLVEIINPKEFKFIGRYDNVINTGGIKVSPELLEKQILPVFHDLDIYTRYIIVGIPDEKFNEVICLVLEGQFDEEIIVKIKNRLPEILFEYHIPKKIYFFKHLPEIPTGKIDRRKVSASFI